MQYMANCGLTTNVKEPHFYSLEIIIILLFGILGYFFMYFYSSPQSHADEVCFPLKLCGLDYVTGSAQQDASESDAGRGLAWACAVWLGFCTSVTRSEKNMPRASAGAGFWGPEQMLVEQRWTPSRAWSHAQFHLCLKQVLPAEIQTGAAKSQLTWTSVSAGTNAYCCKPLSLGIICDVHCAVATRHGTGVQQHPQ